MKTTKLYFVFASFLWDCWECGRFHTIQLQHEELDRDTIALKCERCGSKRKALISFQLLYPDDPKRRKKLNQKDKAYCKKEFDDYIDTLPKKKKKGKRK